MFTYCQILLDMCISYHIYHIFAHASGHTGAEELHADLLAVKEYQSCNYNIWAARQNSPSNICLARDSHVLLAHICCRARHERGRSPVP